MKALTIKQPWAELIACGDKRVENRGWKTNYRGPIAIHAGVNKAMVKLICFPESVDDFVYGAVIATADIIDCVLIGSPESKKHKWLATSVYAEGPWCWILKNVKRLKKPAPAKGKLSFWEWNP